MNIWGLYFVVFTISDVWNRNPLFPSLQQKEHTEFQQQSNKHFSFSTRVEETPLTES